MNLKFWELLQIFIACISPRTNEGILTNDLMTNVLDGEFDQKGYLEVALERMAYPKALGCPGWQLLLPVTDALATNGIDPNRIYLKLKTITDFNPDALKLTEFKVRFKKDYFHLLTISFSRLLFMHVVEGRLELLLLGWSLALRKHHSEFKYLRIRK